MEWRGKVEEGSSMIGWRSTSAFTDIYSEGMKKYINTWIIVHKHRNISEPPINYIIYILSLGSSPSETSLPIQTFVLSIWSCRRFPQYHSSYHQPYRSRLHPLWRHRPWRLLLKEFRQQLRLKRWQVLVRRCARHGISAQFFRGLILLIEMRIMYSQTL